MKKTYKDYLYVLGGTGFSRFAAFINSTIIARWLGPEEFGRFSIFYIVMILSWQVPQAFDFSFIRYAKTSASINEKNDYLKTAVFIKMSYSIFVLALAYPVGYILSQHAFEKPDTLYIIIAGMVTGVFLAFLMSMATVFQEREEFGKYAILPSLQSGGILLILLFLKVSGYIDKVQYTKGFVVIYLAIALMLGTASIIVLLRKTGSIFPVHTEILKKYLSFGKWILGVTIAYYLFQRVDILVLTRYSFFKDIGIYSVAVQPIMVISLLMGSISGVFLPKAMNAVTSRSALSVYLKETAYIMCIPVTGIVVLMASAPYFIRIFYGDQYSASSSILRILLIGWLFASFYQPFSFIFYALNDARTRFFLEFTKIISAFLLLLFLVPSRGIYGAAVAISIALVLNAIISLVILRGKISNNHGLRKEKDIDVININT